MDSWTQMETSVRRFLLTQLKILCSSERKNLKANPLHFSKQGSRKKPFHRVADGTDLALELHNAAEHQSEYSQLQGHPIGYLYGEEKSCRIMRVSNHCYDSQNQPACNYNFGDCCRPYVDRTHCAECVCWEDGTVHPGQVFVDNVDDALFGYCTGLWIGNNNNLG